MQWAPYITSWRVFDFICFYVEKFERLSRPEGAFANSATRMMEEKYTSALDYIRSADVTLTPDVWSVAND